MLTQTLRTLERDGLVTRTVTPSVPVRVDYELTALGRTLLPVMLGIKDWAEAAHERGRRRPPDIRQGARGVVVPLPLAAINSR